MQEQQHGRGPRFPHFALDDLSAEQRALADQIMQVSSVGITGPYNLLLRSPVLGQRVFDLLRYLRWETSLPLRLNEFAILIVARHWRSQVEWYVHGPIAAKAGLSPAIAEDLRIGKRPAGMAADEAVVFDFVTELLTRHAVTDATFARARDILGTQQVVDLTAVTGTYVTIAMLLAMGEEPIPPGKELPFKPGDP